MNNQWISVPDAIETIKWAGPLAFSVAALLIGMRDKRRSAIENSARARQQYNGDLRSWCNESISTLSFAAREARQHRIDTREMSQIIAKLSALADQGRLFFPNLHPLVHGETKESAMRGYRPRILDWLVYAHDLCCVLNEESDSEASRGLALLRRGFTADAQLAIDPRDLFRTMEDFQKLLKEGEFVDITQSHPNLKSVEALIQARKVFLEH